MQTIKTMGDVHPSSLASNRKFMNCCKSIGCSVNIPAEQDFCNPCLERAANEEGGHEPTAENMSQQYPAYYKDVGELTEIDVYAVHHLFEIHDPSGCIHHASKKLLLSGARTGGKSAYKDIKEARDSLTRWLHLNEGSKNKP